MKLQGKDKEGFVSLIGAGPGDQELFTLRGVKRLQEADVVIYDYLANEELLRYCKPECKRIYVGKKAGTHTFAQEDINELIAAHGREGKAVVRLKGGDPFLFGRGGEEVLYLAEAGIAFEVVPGITAGIAGPAYAGIPVTHRELSSSVAFITGHESSEKAESTIDWQGIAGGADTLVFYMGVKNLPTIMQKLKKYGKSGGTPVGVVRWGTYNVQTTITGTIDTITEEADRSGLKPPALIIVGEVVNLREKMRWFDARPLTGKRIVVTRSRTQASKLTAALQEKGADVIEFPTIEITPMEDYSGLDRALKELETYSWIIFTSVNGVRFFFERLIKVDMTGQRVRDVRRLGGIKLGVIGSATAEAVRGYGLVPDLVPSTFTSVGTIEAFKEHRIELAGQNILLPGSEISGAYIPENLREMGANVDVVPVYQNKKPQYTENNVESLFSSSPNLVTFTSSSTVKNLVEIFAGMGKRELVHSIRGASIGPMTSDAARELGVPVVLEAETHTIEGLVRAVEGYLTNEEST